MQLLIQLKNKGFFSTSNGNEDSNEEANDVRLSMNEIAAQVNKILLCNAFVIIEKLSILGWSVLPCW